MKKLIGALVTGFLVIIIGIGVYARGYVAQERAALDAQIADARQHTDTSIADSQKRARLERKEENASLFRSFSDIFNAGISAVQSDLKMLANRVTGVEVTSAEALREAGRATGRLNTIDEERRSATDEAELFLPLGPEHFARLKTLMPNQRTEHLTALTMALGASAQNPFTDYERVERKEYMQEVRALAGADQGMIDAAQGVVQQRNKEHLAAHRRLNEMTETAEQYAGGARETVLKNQITELRNRGLPLEKNFRRALRNLPAPIAPKQEEASPPPPPSQPEGPIITSPHEGADPPYDAGPKFEL